MEYILQGAAFANITKDLLFIYFKLSHFHIFAPQNSEYSVVIISKSVLLKLASGFNEVEIDKSSLLYIPSFEIFIRIEVEIKIIHLNCSSSFLSPLKLSLIGILQRCRSPVTSLLPQYSLQQLLFNKQIKER